MYLEDVIYYMTPILSLVNFILLIVVVSKISGKKDTYRNTSEWVNSSAGKAEKSVAATSSKVNSNNEAGVVFCKNCGNQYYSTSAVCPNCRTPH